MSVGSVRGYVLCSIVILSPFNGRVWAQQAPPQYDVLPPSLTSLSYSTAQVDVRAQAQSVSATAIALDPLSGTPFGLPGGVASGVRSTQIDFRYPNCSQATAYLYASLYPDTNHAQTPGIPQQLNGSIYVPMSAASGTYYACSGYVNDNVGNSQAYAINSSPPSPLIQSLPAIQVLSSPPSVDVTPPVLTKLSISPDPADVTTMAKTFTVILDITDDLSGVNVNRSHVYLYLVSASNQYYSWYSFLTLFSGNANRYQAQIKIPQFSPAGKWMISVELYDKAGNYRKYSPTDLSNAGLPSSTTITDSNSDTTNPQLVSIGFQQGGTGTTTTVVPGSPITVSLQTADAAPSTAIDKGSSGVGYDGYSGCDPSIQVTSQNQYPNDPYKNTTQYQYAGFHSQSLGSMAPTSWTATLNLPPLSEPGAWTVTVWMCDRAGNSSSFQGPMSSLGQQANLWVLYKSDVSDGVLTPTNRTIVDDSSTAKITVSPGLSVASGPSGAPIYNPKVTIDVTPTLAVPVAQFHGFTFQGGPWVSISFADPATNTVVKDATLPPPGSAVTIPLAVPQGTPVGPDPTLVLWSIDNGQAHQTPPCLNYASLNPIVNPDYSVTFSNVCSFSAFFVMKRTGLPGDLNADGAVNCGDVTIVKTAFGKTKTQPGFDARADINGDDKVNAVDLAFILKQLTPGTVCR